MRIAIAFALLAGVFLPTPGPVQAAPLTLGEYATFSQELSGALVREVARRHRYNKRYVYAKRRFDWTYLPYWRPYQYRYWQFYYPYGGPLF
jgi:hypothetical protein